MIRRAVNLPSMKRISRNSSANLGTKYAVNHAIVGDNGLWVRNPRVGEQFQLDYSIPLDIRDKRFMFLIPW